MNIKTVLTSLLLGFVVVSIGFMIFKKTSSNSNLAGVGNHNEATLGSADNSPAGPTLIAYYFHSDKRCTTCLTIEEYAHDAIQNRFSNQMASGEIVFEKVNLDDPENKHYIPDFELKSRTLVITRLQDQKPVKWRDLNQVWQLVRDKEAFFEYVQSATEELLNTTI